MAWSSTTWVVSIAAVVASAGVAWFEGHWRRGTQVNVGFASHGGMWGDLLLLPFVNALVVPWMVPGWWLLGPLTLAVVASVAVHAWWHGGTSHGVRDHMWPSRPTGHWAADLSKAGWCHVVYMTAELALLLAYAATPVPPMVVATVTLLLTVHVPIGLLQPAWFATGRLLPAGRRLTWAALVTLWVVATLKVLV